MGRKIAGFTNAAMDRLTAYDWSGNVRELQNEIERAVALAGDVPAITLEMLSDELRGGAAAAVGELPPASGANLNDAVDALKRQLILEAIRETGSKTRAAERLGIPRQSLQKMMKRLEI
jgi:transcriptional regulator with PAS, ATPase and Fis domain